LSYGRHCFAVSSTITAYSTPEDNSMNATVKIQPYHLALQAMVYIRQSTTKQVLLHTERIFPLGI
jgi:hypothetical protein